MQLSAETEIQKATRIKPLPDKKEKDMETSHQPRTAMRKAHDKQSKKENRRQRTISSLLEDQLIEL
jgi:hypothetical protein